MFSIDHAAVLAELEDLWTLLNYNNIPAAIITVACGWAGWHFLKSMFESDPIED